MSSTEVRLPRDRGSSVGATVLVVGSGGREHALAVALAASPAVSRVIFAGGPNAGMERIAGHVPFDAAERAADGCDLVVIGPEAPLADGMADRLRSRGLAVFGPGAAAAELEASKAFTKEMCLAANIPTARAEICGTAGEAVAAVRRMGAPVVVKADGLASGKGVTVAATLAEAEAAVAACFDGAFGAAGACVLIEEWLEGPEISLFVLSDGATVQPFFAARDFKRAFDGDLGPNTGGMGAISTPGLLDATLGDAAMATIVRPTIGWLAARGIPYVGVLYAGLMLTRDGPKLIEYNVRFGDPECQVILPRLASDPFMLLHAVATGRLGDTPVERRRIASVGVVVAADGYPGPVGVGEVIGGLDAVGEAGATVFHAGTRLDQGSVLSNGGRVLTVVATGDSVAAARETVYRALGHLDWPGGRFRRDIGA